jgi:Protein of unknown function (DUF2550)
LSGELIGAVLGAVLLVFVVTAALGASRLRVLSGRVGSFVCAARPAAGSWSAGIAHYGAGRIDWWRSWSLAPRPSRSWFRDELQVVQRASLARSGDQDLVLVRCRYHGKEFDLTMSADACAGLTAWLEAAPPTGLSRVI